MKDKEKRGDTVIAPFADMKIAFYKLKRKEIWRMIEELGVEEILKERIKGIYEETKNTVRREEGLSKEFWTRMPIKPHSF